jgi:hypothetical protein
MEKLSVFRSVLGIPSINMGKKMYFKFNILCVPRTKWEAVLWQGRLYVSVTQVKYSCSLSPLIYSAFFWH